MLAKVAALDFYGLERHDVELWTSFHMPKVPLLLLPSIASRKRNAFAMF